MIDFGDELDIALRVKQMSYASRSMVRSISQSRANYWLSYVVDFGCPVLFGYLGVRRHPGASLLVTDWAATAGRVRVHTGGVLDPSLAAARSAEHPVPGPRSASSGIREKPSAFLSPCQLCGAGCRSGLLLVLGAADFPVPPSSCADFRPRISTTAHCTILNTRRGSTRFRFGGCRDDGRRIACIITWTTEIMG